MRKVDGAMGKDEKEQSIEFNHRRSMRLLTGGWLLLAIGILIMRRLPPDDLGLSELVPSLEFVCLALGALIAVTQLLRWRLKALETNHAARRAKPTGSRE